jgi:sec-independent protein translocase protein TatA
MPNVGPLELAVVLIVALLVLGPKKLPEVGRSLGRGIREFKESLSMDSSDDIEPDDLEEAPKPLAAAAATAPAAPPSEGAEPKP